MENMRYFKLGERIDFITHYADVQPYCQRLLGADTTNQISLENACELAKIEPDDVEFHRALDDSRLTGKLLSKVYQPSSFFALPIPTDEQFYERFLFKSVILSDFSPPQPLFPGNSPNILPKSARSLILFSYLWCRNDTF